MKKSIVILVLSVFSILLIIVYCFKFYGNKNLNTNPVMQSFNNSGAYFINSEMYFEANLNDECQIDSDLNKLILDLTKSLDIGLDKMNIEEHLSVFENDYMHRMEIRGNTKDKEYIGLEVEILKGKENNPLENKEICETRTIKLTVKGSEPYRRLQYIKKMVEEVFKEYNINPKIDYCITGYYEEELDSEKIDLVCETILKGLETKNMGNNFNKETMKTFMFSPNVENEIKSDRLDIESLEKSEFNVTFKYNEYDKKTYIWVGTPSVIN